MMNLGKECPKIRTIIVDHFATEDNIDSGLSRVRPKPNIWNGPYRFTKEDWFAAGSARNTALCYTRTPWVAFIDDLSVLLPGWLYAARQATQQPRTITLGAYRKVKELVVDAEGRIVSCKQSPILNPEEKKQPAPPGFDNRQWDLDRTCAVGKVWPAHGGQLYGCSLVAPMEAFLAINGWVEDLSGGIGFEDCLTGIVLENAGYKFRYDTRMMTFESDEHHYLEAPFKKTDKGISPYDKSHAALERAKHLRRFDNHFDLAALRQDILAGHSFPIPTEPKLDWFDQQLLSEM